MKQIVNQRFGTLVAKTNSYKKKVEGLKNPYYYVLVECDCGKTKEVMLRSLLSGDTVSCGGINCRPKIDHSFKQKGSYIQGNNKKCSKCLIDKQPNDFFNNKSRPDKLTTWCKLCYSIANYKKKFNLTEDQIDFVINNKHSCGICKVELSVLDGRKLQIDHDHFTGKIRGILCLTCNLAMRETIDVDCMESAIAYIELDGNINLDCYSEDQEYFSFSNQDYNRRKHKYGCDRKTFNKMLNYSRCSCYICKKTLLNKKDVCVDHCHNTQKIRGILCQNCNSFLGYMANDIEKIKSAMKFLQDQSIHHLLSLGPLVT